MLIKFEDENGNIHVIDGNDFDAFVEAMSHENWRLVFDS